MNKLQILEFILIIILLVALFLYVRPNSIQCLSNPTQYGLEKQARAIGNDINCMCSVSSRQLKFISYQTNLSRSVR